MKSFVASIVVVSVILIGAAIFFTRPTSSKYSNLNEFAQCLAQKEITMYGAEWCPHCQREKKNFGEAFKYVPYVECPDNPKQCSEKGVKGYPTWIWPDGKRLEGEQGLVKLARESGCTLLE